MSQSYRYDPPKYSLVVREIEDHLLNRPRSIFRRAWERIRWWARLLHLRPLISSRSQPSSILIRPGTKQVLDQDHEKKTGEYRTTTVPSDPYREFLADIPVMTPQKLLDMTYATQAVVVLSIPDPVIREQCWDWIMRKKGLTAMGLDRVRLDRQPSLTEKIKKRGDRPPPA